VKQVLDFRNYGGTATAQIPGWYDVIDDRGLNQLVTVSGNKVLQPITKGGTPAKPDRPWPLNGSGAAKPNATDTPYSLIFQPYNQQAFTGFVYAI
jgi:hypothetical protein